MFMTTTRRVVAMATTNFSKQKGDSMNVFCEMSVISNQKRAHALKNVTTKKGAIASKSVNTQDEAMSSESVISPAEFVISNFNNFKTLKLNAYCGR